MKKNLGKAALTTFSVLGIKAMLMALVGAVVYLIAGIVIWMFRLSPESVSTVYVVIEYLYGFFEFLFGLAAMIGSLLILSKLVWKERLGVLWVIIVPAAVQILYSLFSGVTESLINLLLVNLIRAYGTIMTMAYTMFQTAVSSASSLFFALAVFVGMFLIYVISGKQAQKKQVALSETEQNEVS